MYCIIFWCYIIHLIFISYFQIIHCTYISFINYQKAKKYNNSMKSNDVYFLNYLYLKNDYWNIPIESKRIKWLIKPLFIFRTQWHTVGLNQVITNGSSAQCAGNVLMRRHPCTAWVSIPQPHTNEHIRLCPRPHTHATLFRNFHLIRDIDTAF